MERPRQQREHVVAELGRIAAVGSRDLAENGRLPQREQLRPAAEQPREERGARMRDVEDEVAAAGQLFEPRPHHRPGHDARPARGTEEATVEEARVAVAFFGDRNEEQRVAGRIGLQGEKHGRRGQGGTEGLDVGGGHVGRHWALKAMEIRGVSAVLGWTKW